MSESVPRYLQDIDIDEEVFNAAVTPDLVPDYASDIKTRMIYDPSENKDIIYREQDCEPIIKEVEDIKLFTDGRGKTSLGYWVGRIPGIISEQYMKEAGITWNEYISNPEHVERIINNPDYKKFKIFQGKI